MAKWRRSNEDPLERNSDGGRRPNGEGRRGVGCCYLASHRLLGPDIRDLSADVSLIRARDTATISRALEFYDASR